MTRGARPLLAVVAGGVLACTTPAPATEGFAFPRHGWSDSGPAALGEGTLWFDRGCLFLRHEVDAVSYLIVWPPDARPVMADGVPGVSVAGGVVRHGEPIRLGGGFYSDVPFVAGELIDGETRDSTLPPACLTPEIFMATELVPAS